VGIKEHRDVPCREYGPIGEDIDCGLAARFRIHRARKPPAETTDHSRVPIEPGIGVVRDENLECRLNCRSCPHIVSDLQKHHFVRFIGTGVGVEMEMGMIGRKSNSGLFVIHVKRQHVDLVRIHRVSAGTAPGLEPRST
jgi:hypothetical protein